MRACLIVILAVSLITFILFGVDKRRARHRAFRIRESVLLGFCFFGGALGGWAAMIAFRHKTRKPRFRFGVPAMFVLHAVLVGYLAWKGILKW